MRRSATLASCRPPDRRCERGTRALLGEGRRGFFCEAPRPGAGSPVRLGQAGARVEGFHVKTHRCPTVVQRGWWPAESR